MYNFINHDLNIGNYAIINYSIQSQIFIKSNAEISLFHKNFNLFI